MNYSGIAVIIENSEREFLLHLRDTKTNKMPDQWCLVGGSLESGEDVLEASIREVKEEIGLDFLVPVQIRDFLYQGKNIALIFGKVTARQHDVVLGEGAKLEFFSKERALELLKSLPYSNPYLEQFSTYLVQNP